MKKRCKICNTEFTPTSNGETLCSDECRKKSKENSRKKCLEKNPNIFRISTAKYIEKNKEKVKQNAKKSQAILWLKKNNITELSEKGKKANITKSKNNEIRKVFCCESVECLIKEFGDIE